MLETHEAVDFRSFYGPSRRLAFTRSVLFTRETSTDNVFGPVLITGCADRMSPTIDVTWHLLYDIVHTKYFKTVVQSRINNNITVTITPVTKFNHIVWCGDTIVSVCSVFMASCAVVAAVKENGMSSKWFQIYSLSYKFKITDTFLTTPLLR